jgi:hypothetical protein
VDDPPKEPIERLKRRVQRHSPHRLLREKLVLPGGVTISAEKHRGRVMVRVEMPQVER